MWGCGARTRHSPLECAHDAQPGHLKVSFFGPFFGSYIVFELDSDYQHAFVAGNTTGYLWLLARTPTISDELKKHFLQRAETLGFEVDDLIFVDQGRNERPLVITPT